MSRFPLCRGTTAALAALASLASVTGATAQVLKDYVATGPEVVLNTEFTQITPVGCPPIGVAGGVFVFRNVLIPEGTTVRGTGANPMIWVVTNDFVVEGHLDVDGGDGQRVDTLQSPQFPSAGGVGNCGGGDGGRGSPVVTGHSPRAGAGFGPNQVPNLGGIGGRLAAVAGCGRGSGGGGGSFATEGDPFYKLEAMGTSFVQQLGRGGFGCEGASGTLSRSLPGGRPGVPVFADSSDENDFFGVALNVQARRLIHGELAAPTGGSGGGGGGDRARFLGAGTSWQSDNKGGGGGAGGGVLIILAGNKIRVGPRGSISSNGGNGGGGEQAGANNQGGGGGGGSGGMLVLYSLGEIELHVHGETYANNDYDFSLSADGGIGAQGAFSGLEIRSKYPPASSAFAWDMNPNGGFGGLGLIQLHTRPGSDALDRTGTVLDDNIHFITPGGTRLAQSDKQRYLAWRGFRNQLGIFVDDRNNPTYNNPPSTPGYPAWATSRDDEGDMRPAPVLLPILR